MAPPTSATAATAASYRRLAAMGLISSVLALFGCDQQKVDEAMKKAGDTAHATWNSVKPDSQLFKGIVVGESSEDDVRKADLAFQQLLQEEEAERAHPADAGRQGGELRPDGPRRPRPHRHGPRRPARSASGAAFGPVRVNNFC